MCWRSNFDFPRGFNPPPKALGSLQVLAADAFKANWEKKEDESSPVFHQSLQEKWVNPSFSSNIVLYGFPINISIVGFWGGFADACSKEPERWERIYQKQQQLLAQAKYRWGAERLEFEPLNTTGLMRFHGILIGFYRDLMINLVESITHMENSWEFIDKWELMW